jgi:hypothetical protein
MIFASGPEKTPLHNTIHVLKKPVLGPPFMVLNNVLQNILLSSMSSELFHVSFSAPPRLYWFSSIFTGILL